MPILLLIAAAFLLIAAVKAMTRKSAPAISDGPKKPELDKAKPEKELPPDPAAVVVYRDTDHTGTWTCPNCECENPNGSANCCVCNFKK